MLQYECTRCETIGSDRRLRKMSSGSVLHQCGCVARTKALGHTAVNRPTKGLSGKRLNLILNPKAATTANQWMGEAPYSLHMPQGDQYGRKLFNRGRSQCS
jgi:hypothetical protein